MTGPVDDPPDSTADLADVQAVHSRRVTRALAGDSDLDLPSPAALRGLAWGVLVAVLVAVVVFAVVLVGAAHH